MIYMNVLRYVLIEKKVLRRRNDLKMIVFEWGVEIIKIERKKVGKKMKIGWKKRKSRSI